MVLQMVNNLDSEMRFKLDNRTHVVPLTNLEAERMWENGEPVFMIESRFKEQKSFRHGVRQFPELTQIPAYNTSMLPSFDMAMRTLVPNFQMACHRLAHDGIAYATVVDDRVCVSSGSELMLFSGNVYISHNTLKRCGVVYFLSPGTGRYTYMGFLNRNMTQTRNSIHTSIECMLAKYHGAHL